MEGIFYRFFNLFGFYISCIKHHICTFIRNCDISYRSFYIYVTVIKLIYSTSHATREESESFQGILYMLYVTSLSLSLSLSLSIYIYIYIYTQMRKMVLKTHLFIKKFRLLYISFVSLIIIPRNIKQKSTRQLIQTN